MKIEQLITSSGGDPRYAICTEGKLYRYEVIGQAFDRNLLGFKEQQGGVSLQVPLLKLVRDLIDYLKKHDKKPYTLAVLREVFPNYQVKICIDDPKATSITNNGYTAMLTPHSKGCIMTLGSYKCLVDYQYNKFELC